MTGLSSGRCSLKPVQRVLTIDGVPSVLAFRVCNQRSNAALRKELSELFAARKAVFRRGTPYAEHVIACHVLSLRRAWCSHLVMAKPSRLRAERPNTSEVGSGNLKQAAEQLGTNRNNASWHHECDMAMRKAVKV